ncbi:hypothetical protein BDW75DRAFT_243312 [Aspergillus navahoensis]
MNKKAYFEHFGWQSLPIYRLESLKTILATPNANATALETHVISEISPSPELNTMSRAQVTTVDPVQLSVFGHRYMEIAEQMGRTLQKTSMAGWWPTASHVPVHLGSMQYAACGSMGIQRIILETETCWYPTNSVAEAPIPPTSWSPPPAFKTARLSSKLLREVKMLTSAVSQRGSLPPNPTELWQDGAAIESDLLVRDGVFKEDVTLERIFLSMHSILAAVVLVICPIIWQTSVDRLAPT